MTEEGREFQLNGERDRDRVVASIRGQFQLCFVEFQIWKLRFEGTNMFELFCV